MANRVERKCPHCGKWNDHGGDHCSACGKVINPQTLHEEHLQRQEDESRKRPPGKVERFLDNLKNNRNPLVKGAYWILRSIWMVYISILAFFLWLIAATPG